MGDGCLQCFEPNTYKYVISGSRQDEQEYYRFVLAPLLRRLYDVNPRIVEHGGSTFVYVYSKDLVLFKSAVLGMPVGRKDKLKRLPDVVRDSGNAWVAQFLAGLYDADGSIKLRKTPSRGYPRISFAQKMQGVVSEVRAILRGEFSITSTMYKNAYFDPRVAKSEVRWFLDINGFDNFRLFVQDIGTRSPHVLSRIKHLGLSP
jgi:hypothetical protein